MNTILKVIIFSIIYLLLIVSCKKEEPKVIKLTLSVPSLDTIVTIGDTILIQGVFENSNTSDVDLFVESKLIQTKSSPPYNFNWAPKNTYRIYDIFLRAKIGSEYIQSNTIHVNCNPISTSGLRLVFKNNKNTAETYIGDSLTVTLKPDASLNIGIKQLTLFFNGIDLGTITEPPFTFKTPPALDNNVLIAKYTDNNNIKRLYTITLFFINNSIPEISYTPAPRSGLFAGYFFTSENISMELDTKDNEKVHYARIYLDNTFYKTDTLDSNYIWNRTINFGKLKAGNHTSYCVCYDNRGDSAVSQVNNLYVYSDINGKGALIEFVKTENNNVIYGLNQSSLLQINPLSGTITEEILLPYTLPVSLEYSSISKRTYISFSNGKIVYKNDGESSFTDLSSKTFNLLKKIEIDEVSHQGFLLCNNRLIILNLTTDDTTSLSNQFDENSILGYSDEKKTILVGGDSKSSRGDVYSFKNNNGVITPIKMSNILGFSKKFIFNNSKSYFLIGDGRDGFDAFNLDNISDLVGNFNGYFLAAGTFSAFENYFYSFDTDSHLLVYNSSTFLITRTMYCPYSSNINTSITNSDNSYLIGAYDNKIIFIPTNAINK